MHLGIIGYGSIARALISRLPPAEISEVTVLVRPSHREGAQAGTPHQVQVSFVTSRDALIAATPDLIVECAGHSAVTDHGVPLVESGISLVVASVGVLADDTLLTALKTAEEKSGARLILPTGAIGGLDLLEVLARDQAVEVVYTGTKPPQAWKGSPAEMAIDLDNISTPTVFYEGTGRDAAAAYPKNANVVAALALAGAGFDRLRVTLVADPEADTNLHAYHVQSDACSYTIEISNIASPDNPKTSLTTVLSLLSEVTSFAAGLHR